MEPTPSASGAGPAPQHEFDSQQNQVISNLANALRWVAAPLFFLGVLYSLAAILSVVQAVRTPEHWFAAIYIGLIALLVASLARWTKQAADAFQRVVSTSGRDIVHLMEALDNLRKKYTLLSVFVKIYVAILLVSLIFMIVMLTASMVAS